jgi:hypothetical protein
MNSEKFGSILGTIVAAAVLALAVVYGPVGQLGKAPKTTQKAEQPVQRVAPAPAVRGPVIREVPQ